jgi:hypothetical protein
MAAIKSGSGLIILYQYYWEGNSPSPFGNGIAAKVPF